MKKIFILTALLLLSWGTLSAQDAQAILKRYNKIIGTDKIDTDKGSIRINMTVSANGMQMKILSIIQLPDKIRMEMNAMGQKILMVANGKKGWVQVPGLPLQPIPETELTQLFAQGNPFSSNQWNMQDYDLKLLEPTTIDEKRCDVVEMTAKNSNATISRQIVYFERKSGLAIRSDIDTKSIKTEVLMKEYTKNNKIQYPALIESRTSGVTSVIRIDAYQTDYPVTDQMFTIQQE